MMSSNSFSSDSNISLTFNVKKNQQTSIKSRTDFIYIFYIYIYDFIRASFGLHMYNVSLQ